MSQVMGSQVPPALPPKDGIPASIHSVVHRQRQAEPSEWRNSLIAIDDETGAIIGVVATGVVLSPEDNDQDAESSSSEEEDSEEAIKPMADLDYMAAHVYNDPDVRPPSRAASILREETFAPPPIPKKPDHLQAKERETNLSLLVVHSPKVEEEAEVEDGKIKVHVSHAEAHRPDLLRERPQDEDKEYDSDASGSTVGGPAVQLWRKARGGKKAEAKRKAKKEVKKVAVVELPETYQVQKSEKDSLPVQPEIIAEASTKNDTISSTKNDIISSTKNDTTSSRRVVSDAGDEEGAIELNTKGGAGYWLNETKKSVMSRHLPGNSVLIEFLAGSRIGASMINSASSFVLQERSKASLRGTDVFTPTCIAPIPQTGVLSYIPILPTHLLWFFGLGESEKTATEQQTLTDEAPVAVMGEDLLTIVKSTSPSGLVQLATQSASAAWSSLYDWSASATSWLGSGLSFYSLAGIGEVNLNQVEAGEDDAEEWEWTIPECDPKSLENTPRPIYRRKKLQPSVEGRFNHHQGSNRYSIVHVDHLGIPRRAVTRNQPDLPTLI